MIKVIDNMPVGTIGLEASGKVSEEDYRDVLIPTVEAAMAAGDVRMLYVVRDHSQYSPGAMWTDTKLWAKNVKKWKRIAIVTDADWIENSVKAFGWMMPGKVRVFDDDEVREAKTWLVGIEDDDD